MTVPEKRCTPFNLARHGRSLGGVSLNLAPTSKAAAAPVGMVRAARLAHRHTPHHGSNVVTLVVMITRRPLGTLYRWQAKATRTMAARQNAEMRAVAR